MRTIIELPEEQLQALSDICLQEKASRAEIIRRAVDGYIQGKQAGKGRNAFGLWKKKKVDALKYESRLRAEWGNDESRLRHEYPRGLSQRIPAASRELELYEEIAISIVTWMEVLAGAEDAEEEAITREFFSRFKVQTVEKVVAERAIKIRRQHKLKLPDAIIWATAKELWRILVMRNTKDFSEKDAGIRVPYKI